MTTKKELLEKTKTILNTGVIGSVLDGGNRADDFKHMLYMFSRHPHYAQFVGEGIEHVKIIAGAYNQRAFQIIRKDGSKGTIGYKACLDTHDAICTRQGMRALRNGIRYQGIECRDAFRFAGNNICPVTGYALTRENSDVDHAPPNVFSVIVKDFLTPKKLHLKNIPIKWISVSGKEEGVDDPVIADQVLLDQWKVFHKERATLRVIWSRFNRWGFME